jgi:hypothetical protein
MNEMSSTELKYNLFKAIDAIHDGKSLKAIYAFISKKRQAIFGKLFLKNRLLKLNQR